MSTPEHPGQGDQDAPISEDEFQAWARVVQERREQAEEQARPQLQEQLQEQPQAPEMLAREQEWERAGQRELALEQERRSRLDAWVATLAPEHAAALAPEHAKEWEQPGDRPPIREATGYLVFPPGFPGEDSRDPWFGVMVESHAGGGPELSTEKRRELVARAVEERRELENEDREHENGEQGRDR
jgi:hypothetical protein